MIFILNVLTVWPIEIEICPRLQQLLFNYPYLLSFLLWVDQQWTFYLIFLQAYELRD